MNELNVCCNWRDGLATLALRSASVVEFPVFAVVPLAFPGVAEAVAARDDHS